MVSSTCRVFNLYLDSLLCNAMEPNTIACALCHQWCAWYYAAFQRHQCLYGCIFELMSEKWQKSGFAFKEQNRFVIVTKHTDYNASVFAFFSQQKYSATKSTRSINMFIMLVGMNESNEYLPWNPASKTCPWMLLLVAFGSKYVSIGIDSISLVSHWAYSIRIGILWHTRVFLYRWMLGSHAAERDV